MAKSGLTDLRYATPSPNSPPACERSSPFFLKTKLEPISKPLDTANTIPTICELRNRVHIKWQSYALSLALRLELTARVVLAALEDALAVAEVALADVDDVALATTTELGGIGEKNMVRR